MRRSTWITLAATIAFTQPALADEIVHYSNSAEWVDELDRAKINLESSTPIAALDIQQKLEGGEIAVYVDQALKLDSPEALTQAGSSALTWQPEKGSLTVHRVQILRGRESIDVLEGGAEYTVLRRETQLEQRQLNGFLTATMPIPGLRIGDVLRVSFTQTLKDDALQGHVQQISPLISKPVEAAYGSLKLSWPKDERVSWAVSPDAMAGNQTVRGAFNSVSIKLPLPKRDDLPSDAPMRVTRPPIFQATTFTDWQQVSEVFAPLYAAIESGLLDPSLSAEIEDIGNASPDALHRAALATQLVQSKVSYLLDGMSGGNYIPQSPNETWKLRYGDCKAKSLLLLTILRQLNIDAEAVLVNATIGDAVIDSLPMPAAFDHVIVRATVGGVDYWLDGTSAGTRLANIADTPGFRYFLPIRSQGTDLQVIESRIPAAPNFAVEITLDQRAGIDLPSIAEVTATLRGAMASQLGAMIKQVNEDQRKEMISGFAQSQIGGASVFEGDFSYEEAAGIATFQFSAIQTTPWKNDGGQKRQRLNLLPSTRLNFDPDRNRPAWQDIPVNLGDPSLQHYDLKILLPENEPGYAVKGRADIDLTFTNTRVSRTAQLDGTVFEVEERIASTGGEWPASDLPREKTNAQRIKNSSPFLIAPADASRAWEYGKPQLRERTERLEDAYQKAIDRNPDDAQFYINRARFRFGTTNFKGALADYTNAIELDATPESYISRSGVHREMGEQDKAVRDAREAFKISPSAHTALVLAGLLGETGETNEALELVEEFDDYGENHEAFAQTHADILAYGGRADEGLTVLTDLIEERPGQGHLYNASCWYRVRFDVGTEELPSLCDQAVAKGNAAAASLDSRAFAKLKLGDPIGALADAEAAISLDPTLRQTHYVRAFVQRALGEKSAQQDINYLSNTFPGMALEYAKYGLKP